METSLILKNFDNGTITKDAAIDLLLQHTPRAYAIGAYLEARIQRDDYRDQLYAAQDAGARPIMDGHVITDLIDHALDTDHILPQAAEDLLVKAGMDRETASHHVDIMCTITDRDLERADYLDDPDHAPRWCTRCGRQVTADKLSNKGICKLCSADAQEENIAQLRRKAGPLYTRWRDAMLSFAYKLEDQAIKERPDLYAGTLGDYIDHDKRPGCDDACEECAAIECAYRTGRYAWMDDRDPEDREPQPNHDRQIENDQIAELPS